jgi:tight adherence protein C
MSNTVILILALFATFWAIVLVAVVVNLQRVEKVRTERILGAVGSSSTTNVREQDLDASLLQRVLLPGLSSLGNLARRMTPGDSRVRIEHRLALAGSPHGWTAERVGAAKLAGAVIGAFVGAALAQAVGASGLTLVGLAVLIAGLGFFTPNGILASRAEDRQEEIRKVLPDTMDLLTISVEAGLGFDAAVAQVMTNVPGVLSQEFSRMLQEMRLGVGRQEAFRHLADRTDVEELRSFILAMIQADKFGVSIANVLRAQAHELRIKRRQRAEERAMKVPVKILFPMIFCVMPALFTVILGPGVIQIIENLFGLDN